ncbi:MAG: carboxypeptidase-like regulatory domain-containing protein [Nocardioidaceae bacterium]
MTARRLYRNVLVAGMLLAVVAACGTAASGGSGGSARPTAQLTGHVLVSPTCPVERPGSACSPAPVADALVQLMRGDAVVAQTRTSPGGAFRLTVDPGAFTVRVSNPGRYPSQATRQVTLTSGATATLRLVLDSGIR